ncbi:hypothetical protein F4803DRAFT_522446 [Xylaria telfairii]|nr:hypothetical protein F4803DRAFT_522446 [Xylaria telfairii]
MGRVDGRFETRRETTTLTRKPKASWAAVRPARNEHPDKITYLNSGDVLLGFRYTRNGAMSNLDETIIVASRIAIRAPHDKDLTPLRNSNFRLLLLQRYRKRWTAVSRYRLQHHTVTLQNVERCQVEHLTVCSEYTRAGLVTGGERIGEKLRPAENLKIAIEAFQVAI